MQVYVDCEFTDFINCELISIALIAEDGRELYAEIRDFDKSACSEFVRHAVLPQLGQFPEKVHAEVQLRELVMLWLADVCGESECLICVDNVIDWDLLIELLGEVPSNCRGAVIASLIDQGVRESYFQRHGGRHHALHDARAMKAATAEDLSTAFPVEKIKPTRYF